MIPSDGLRARIREMLRHFAAGRPFNRQMRAELAADMALYLAEIEGFDYRAAKQEMRHALAELLTDRRQRKGQ